MPTKRFAGGVAIITEQEDWKPGDQPPADKNDYLAWHAWADVQYKAGIRQKQCRRCGLWRTPQELSTIIDKGTAYTRGGQPVTIEKPVCNNCARLSAARPPDARRR